MYQNPGQNAQGYPTQNPGNVPNPNFVTNQEQERIIAQFRRSILTLGFWWRALFTLGLYVLLLWPRNKITLTNRRLMQRTGGVIVGQEMWLNIEHITDVNLRVSLFGQLFGYGDIYIQSFAGTARAEIMFQGLEGAARLREVIFRLQDNIKRAM
jgi:uncharacterized membrane protein YdbT with pleckstrin-like domain